MKLFLDFSGPLLGFEPFLPAKLFHQLEALKILTIFDFITVLKNG